MIICGFKVERLVSQHSHKKLYQLHPVLVAKVGNVGRMYKCIWNYSVDNGKVLAKWVECECIIYKCIKNITQ